MQHPISSASNKSTFHSPQVPTRSASLLTKPSVPSTSNFAISYSFLIFVITNFHSYHHLFRRTYILSGSNVFCKLPFPELPISLASIFFNFHSLDLPTPSTSYICELSSLSLQFPQPSTLRTFIPQPPILATFLPSASYSLNLLFLQLFFPQLPISQPPINVNFHPLSLLFSLSPIFATTHSLSLLFLQLSFPQPPNPSTSYLLTFIPQPPIL